MSLPTPPEYFLEVPLYRELSLEARESGDATVRILFFDGSLDAHCVECNSMSVFQSQVVLPELHPDPNSMSQAQSTDELLKVGSAFLPTGDGRGYVSHQDIREYVSSDRHWETVFVCSRDSTHDLRVLSRVSAGKLQKVGQFPSLADLHSAGLGKYRKVLGRHYPELARGVGLFAHGVGIGAFVYLRRLFERLIEAAKEEASESPDWNETEYQQGRMDDRIKLLAPQLPEFVVRNRSIYRVLSKGVHELSEAECLQYFPAVRMALELMLDAKLEALLRAEKVAESEAAVQRVLSEIGRSSGSEERSGA